jgi:hypothetical protein
MNIRHFISSAVLDMQALAKPEQKINYEHTGTEKACIGFPSPEKYFIQPCFQCH